MKFRSASCRLLLLVLLLVPVVDSIGHNHLDGHESLEEQCAIDHAALEGAADGIPHLTDLGEPHEHRCAACRIGGLRLSLAPEQGLASPALSLVALAVADSARRAVLPWAGRTSRGPPSV